MNNPGAAADNPFELLARTRTVLLDALEALVEHRDVVIVVGAQAVYLHTGGVEVAIAEATKDSDVAVDTRDLGGDPTINEAMEKANFVLNPTSGQPGAWLSPDGIPVDIMVPETIAGGGKNRRSVHQPPHHKMAMRRARGLEAAIVDNSEIVVRPLTEDDGRAISAKVAGPAALIVAKCHKIHERIDDPNPDRLKDKDAHDIYRILRAFEPEDLAPAFSRLLAEEVSAQVTDEAVDILQNLFAAGPDAIGSAMAGRAEEEVGDPAEVSASLAFLAEELVEAIRSTALSEACGSIRPMTSGHQQRLTTIRDAIEGKLRRGGAWDDLAYAVAPGAPANQTLDPVQVAALDADLALVQEALDGKGLSDEKLSQLNRHIDTGSP
ncbi:hypothetical protein [Nocardia testacea]|uniref:hypothetical protein n=1 Tax=Nocardia testacea TaxID=248551 RepID=UPI0002E7A2F7|nr:hypothetical protein [Nocardia testacea]